MIGLEDKVTELQRLLDDANRRLSDEGQNNDTLSVERDRAVKKLQEACHNIGDLMDKVDLRDRQLQDTKKQLDATLQSKDISGDLRTEMNALKHAFPNDRSDGRITVGYDAAGTNWKLSVIDNGIGKPDGVFAQAKSGLGTSIVKALAQQLGAQVQTLAGPKGTTVSVTHATFSAKTQAA